MNYPILRNKNSVRMGLFSALAFSGFLIADATATLTFDLRVVAIGGLPVSDPKNLPPVLPPSTEIQIELWASVTGAPGNAALDGFTNGYGSILATGGSGNFTGFVRDSDFNGTAAQNGLVQDLNGDGFMDIGSNATKTTTDANPLLSGLNLIFSRSTTGTAQTVGDRQIPDGQEFRLGLATFITQNSNATSIAFRVPTFTLGSQVEALWQQDGAAQNSNGSGGGVFPSVGAPIVTVPEPSAFGMIVLGAMGIVGFRRIGIRRA